AVVRVDARHMVVLQLLQVAVELDMAFLLGDTYVRRDVPRDAVAGRSPRDPAPVTGDVVEQVPHLADVDRLEGEVVEVRTAEVEERQHVVVGVDVKPDARVTEPVGHVHPEHLGVEPQPRLDVAGQAVHVTELPRAADADVSRGTSVLRPPLDLARGLAIRHHLDRPAVGIADEERAVVLLPPDVEALEFGERVVHGGRSVQLERVVVETGLGAVDELEAVRLVVAGEERAPGVARALDAPALQTPPPRSLLDIRDAEAHVVDPPQPHRTVSSATIRAASSSGIASATCNVCADTCGCSPGPVRSTSQSTTVFVRRPRPVISTSTTSPGSIGREFAGVPVRITSPGSSVIRRQRSASWSAS